ncbi:MAG: cation-transporting P-type ATPase, partial [Candidatus Heimdallarchaeota archaeon]|nr:cation-transporting P-type ATPase [Candidatus Heimdallarchaeota archaeon]
MIFRYETFTWDLFKTALIDSIFLGMKVMPITLPLLITIVLLTGVLALAKKGVIVREISRTESLGRVSVVCTDKTGTLTKNEMTVVKIWTPVGEYDVDGFGYAPQGKVLYAGNKTTSDQNEDLDQLVLSGYLNNNSTIKSEVVETLGRGKTKIKWTILGLPTEAALKVLGQKYQKDIETTVQAYNSLWEFNFDSSIKRMSSIFTNHEDTLLFTKGATEWILPLCSQYQNNGKTIPLNEEMRLKILDSMHNYASQGYRLLSITIRKIPKEGLSKNYEKEGVRELYETDLTFLGFVIILDPPRDDVFDAIKECKSAGITTIMITGDSISTGTAIAKQLGIYTENQ